MSTDLAALRRVAALAVVGALASASLVGCGYPRVSESALRLAQAIDTVTNLRDPAQIPKGREIVDARFAEGEIDESERDMLQSILDRAEAGDWEGAEANARALLYAQNGGSRALRAECSCCAEKEATTTDMVKHDGEMPDAS